jgi:predicted ATP-dependent endonuclease of OLD family
MPGRAKAPMEAKMREIGLFIRDKLDYQYIPCVRTADFTSEYFSQLVNKELDTLRNNSEYIECIEKIKNMQAPIYTALGERLTRVLKTFLPKIEEVSIRSDMNAYSNLLHITGTGKMTSLFINDGNNTPLEEKGDGVKSLTAIGLVQSLSFEHANNKSLILCIEEPEAHLHPDAIHSLRNIIFDLSHRNGVQVVISTHSPLLVDREEVCNNVIIDSNYRVSNCTGSNQIRNVLGVRLTDNMVGAQKVVLVEGESDKRYFEKLCSEKFPELLEKIENGELEFVNVHSASKMDYQIRLYNSLMIPTLVLLDNDDSGKQTQRFLLGTH